MAVLQLLEAIRSQIGLKRTPALLVTPEPISPCFAGTWNPRIILPESIITAPLTASLRHVLAHELAHLVRGDLWTNWLLLAVRILHWFNPVAWWTIRQMQAEREAACDEMALAALGDGVRPAYAATLVELAANLAPSAIAPGMIGLFSSTGRLRARVERLVRRRSVTTLRTPIAAGLLLGIALVGLTDAMPAVVANKSEAKPSPIAANTEGPSAEKQKAEARTHTIRGRCVDHIDSSALAGVNVRLFKVPGRTLPIVEIAQTHTDGNGRFEFTGLVPPRPYGRFDRLIYVVYALAEDRPIGAGGNSYQPHRNARDIEIRISRKQSTLSGKVVNASGQSVAGATVMTWSYEGRPIPGMFSATTGADGRFAIDKLMDGDVSFDVVHPDYPATTGHANALRADVAVKLPTGCTLSGQVTDTVTGRPSAGALVTSERLGSLRSPPESVASTDAAGRFRIIAPEGRYNFLVDAAGSRLYRNHRSRVSGR